MNNGLIGNPVNGPVSPGAARAWFKYNLATQTVQASYNIARVVRNGTGDFAFTTQRPFASGQFIVLANARGNSGLNVAVVWVSPDDPGAANGKRLLVALTGVGFYDSSEVHVVCFGE